jgi:glucosamine-6-phosphate deaminase
MPVLTVTTRAEAEREVAREIVELVSATGQRSAPCVLGLATGGTMVGVYTCLVAAARERAVSFAHVDTVNLDEYLGLGPEHPSSFAAFMREHLFRHLDFDPARCVVPDGRRASGEPVVVARELEAHIARLGGIDLQLLGLGRNGHLAFNEPGAAHTSRTRVVALARETREDAIRVFGGLAHVPRRAITLGLGTILGARRLRVLAFGAAKASAVASVFTDAVNRANPASALRSHSDVHLWVDADAARLVPRGVLPPVDDVGSGAR